MPGNSKPRKRNSSRHRKARRNTGGAKREDAPGLPTSGQILGVLVRSLGIIHPHPGDKTVQRYFSGRLQDRVLESSRSRIFGAILENMAAALFTNPIAEDDEEVPSSPVALSTLLDWHACTWDLFRAFLLPRVMRRIPWTYEPGLALLR